jgi:hypothetical protein
VVRWRLIDLSQWIYEEFRVTVAKQTLSRELRAMGYRKLSARPRHHAQAEAAIEDFKKTCQRAWMKLPAKRRLTGDKIEIWFADEARIGQKNKITRRWAKRGSRPSAPRDQRTASTYIFGAICPKEGKGAALILPACNTEAMNLHLTEIAKPFHQDPTPSFLSIRPDGICRHDWLSNRVFKSYDDIVDHCCYPWNTLLDRPWKIMSIGLRQWAHEF